MREGKGNLEFKHLSERNFSAGTQYENEKEEGIWVFVNKNYQSGEEEEK